MRVTILRNPGTELLAKLGLSDRAAQLTEGAQVDVPDDVATALAKANVAGPSEVRGVPPRQQQMHGNQGGNKSDSKGSDPK
jgi:hypothetical protein